MKVFPSVWARLWRRKEHKQASGVTSVCLADAKADAEALAQFQEMRRHFSEMGSEIFLNCLRSMEFVFQLPASDDQLASIDKIVSSYKTDPAATIRKLDMVQRQKSSVHSGQGDQPHECPPDDLGDIAK